MSKSKAVHVPAGLNSYNGPRAVRLRPREAVNENRRARIDLGRTRQGHRQGGGHRRRGGAVLRILAADVAVQVAQGGRGARLPREVRVDRNRPAFIHGSYLVNVGGNPDLLGKSIESLVRTLEAASQLGAVGVIFHGGSHKGAGFDAVFDQAIAALTLVLERTPDDARLLIENSAGMGSHIGSSFAEIGRMVEALGNDRVGVCLDTQHSIAAGYNIIEPSGIEDALDEFDREIGLDRLVVVHANDSKTPLGSGVDRHENIGEGSLGEAGFETIMGHDAFRDIPFILEVPGFGEDHKGPDKENVDRLKAVRNRVGLAD